MPDETKDQFGKEEAVKGASDRQTDGSVSSVADAASPPEEEPVGSNRGERRPVRKMSAADFKIKSEPKPEPPAPEPVQPVTAPKEAQRGPIPSARPPEAAQEKGPAEATYVQEPEPVYHEPVYEQPKYEYNDPVKEPEYANERPSEPEPEPKKKEINVPSGSGGASGGIMGALKAAFSFFTIIPIKVEGKEINAMNNNMYVVPVVGFVIGIIASLIGLLFARVEAVAMAGIAVIATSYIITKFLHFDGLADFGDGMICGGDREKRINALKDARIGAGGLGMALIVVLAIFVGINGVAVYWGGTPTAPIAGFFLFGMAIVIMEVFAKNAMVVAAAFGEPGNGMASEQVRNTTVQTMLMSTILSAGFAFVGYLALSIATGAVFGSIHGVWSETPMVTAVLMIAGGVAASFAVGWLAAHLSNKKFGFVNGDVLGASNEISKAMFLFIALMILGFYTFG